MPECVSKNDLPDQVIKKGNMTIKPEDVNIWIGLDVGKEEHFADVLDTTGDRLSSSTGLYATTAMLSRTCSTERFSSGHRLW
jgi:hypothetical protein